MTAPVDVLARIESVWGKESPEYAAAASLACAARAAVPVLRHVKIHDYNKRNYRDEVGVQLDHLRASIARFEGEGATP